MMDQYSDQNDQNQPTDNQQEAQQTSSPRTALIHQASSPVKWTTLGRPDRPPSTGCNNRHRVRSIAPLTRFAGRVPGGQQYAQQAKDTSSGGLDALEHAVEGKLGGLFGHGHTTEVEQP